MKRLFSLLCIAIGVLLAAPGCENKQQAALKRHKEAMQWHDSKTNEAGFAEFDRRQRNYAGKILALPMAKSQFFLYSLNPDHEHMDRSNDVTHFHGYGILGKAEILAPDDKTTLIKELTDGIVESDSITARCFNPRHGIRIISGSGQVDFLICYECGDVLVYGNEVKNPSDEELELPTSDTPVVVFNDYLDKFGLPRSR